MCEFKQDLRLYLKWTRKAHLKQWEHTWLSSDKCKNMTLPVRIYMTCNSFSCPARINATATAP